MLMNEWMNEWTDSLDADTIAYSSLFPNAQLVTDA